MHLGSMSAAIVQVAVLGALPTGQAHALAINLTYGAGFAAGSAARQTADIAAQWWQNAILTDFTVAITVAAVEFTGSDAGYIGRTHSNTQSAAVDLTTGTKLPTAGVLELNTRQSFFYDDTPKYSTEFDMTRENGLFGDAKAGSAAAGKWDALSVLLHELGHALGMVRYSGTWADGKTYTAFDAFVDNFASTAPSEDFVFDFLVGGKEGNKGGTGGAASKVAFSGTHIDDAANPTYATKLMAGGGFGAGQRSLLTPLDIDITCDAFHLKCNDTSYRVPASDTLYLVALGLLISAGLTRHRPTAVPGASDSDICTGALPVRR